MIRSRMENQALAIIASPAAPETVGDFLDSAERPKAGRRDGEPEADDATRIEDLLNPGPVVKRGGRNALDVDRTGDGDPRDQARGEDEEGSWQDDILRRWRHKCER